MDGTDVTDVCRLCPARQGLVSVFDERLTVRNNMKEVILVTTGIEILENDLISKKICHRCGQITLQMWHFRLAAIAQDNALKERCSRYLGDKGIRLPNTSVTIKQERRDLCSLLVRLKTEPFLETKPSTSKQYLKDKLHPSITQLYQTFPNLKLPKACVDRHMAPVVSLPMGDVEKYFKSKKLNMKHYIYKARRIVQNKDKVNKVAKKRTSAPSTLKVVAPIKISKKLFGNCTESTKAVDSYVCTRVDTPIANRKRSISSSDTDKRSQSKAIKESEPKVPQVSVTNDSENCATTKPVPNKLINKPPTSAVPPSSKVPDDSSKPKKLGEHSEESRDSIGSNFSAGTTSSYGSQPDFLESFGLAPTVTATKSQTMLVCNLCGSVHNNAFELKRHNKKHMVCQFCKCRFKSLEAKQDHIDNKCVVKEINNSPGPIVSLEPVHLDLEIRKKHQDAFATFETIPGLHEIQPVVEVIVRAVSPPAPIRSDNVIVLSDDEDAQLEHADPLSGIPTPAANMPPPALETVVYNTVSIVRPDIRIKNNPILNSVPTNITDEQVIRELQNLLKPKKVSFEKMLQTDLPANRDIKINNLEGTCEFRNLKEQLLTYKVPIIINNGPFHVNYQFKKKPKSGNKAADWITISMIDVKENSNDLQIKQNAVTTNNHKSEPPKTSQSVAQNVIPLVVSSSTPRQSAITVATSTPLISLTPVPNNVVPSTAPPIPSPASKQLILNNQVSVPTSQPLFKNYSADPVSSNSATPLMHNYALSMSQINPVTANRPPPIPKTFVNAAINNRTVYRNNAVNVNYVPRSSMVARFSLSNAPPRPGNVVNTSTYIPCVSNYIPTNGNPSPVPPRMVPIRPPANPVVRVPENNSVPNGASADASKFRVKNVWELQ